MPSIDIPQRRLGHSGLKVSLVGLGTNNFGSRLDLDASRKVIHAALDAGITLLDTADVYGNKGGSESILGKVLGEQRKHVVLASKFGNPFDEQGKLRGASRRYIFQAVEASLRRLQTDWIDLYQVHRPDPGTPIEETVEALDNLVRQGKVRYLGLSNFAPWQIVEAQRVARERGLAAFISAQDEYSLLQRKVEGEHAVVLERYGLGLLPYFPLASGFLSGKYQQHATLPENSRLTTTPRLGERYLNEHNWAVVEQLRAFSESRGHSLLELAFSWLAARPWVASIIAGASTVEQIAANATAASWQLTTDELLSIDQITAAPALWDRK
ncbi:aldo/keto reductase [Pseudomonas sp. MYb185]|uniref:aldo/keto reductase n=1 Tax=Pseudomonas sp. MYb185 TaxID=1848729 RepID=UPI001C447E42|nr:aldo/keto reductase [Pseudomonas sp. MYb185]